MLFPLRSACSEDDISLESQTDHRHSSPNPRYFLFDRFSLLYTAIAVPLIAYCSLGHSLIFGARLKFLPLMFISSYSAVGVVASWIGFVVVFFDS
jgi:alpha-1,3-glucosyltransferase